MKDRSAPRKNLMENAESGARETLAGSQIEQQRPMTNSFLLRQSLGLGTLAFINSILAVLTASYIVLTIGVSEETDAYFAAGALPQFVFLVLSATLLPVLVPLLATRGEQNFAEDLWSFLTLISAFFTATGLILYSSAGVWVPLFVPGFSAAGKGLTQSLVGIQVISMILNAAIVTLWAGHHARRRFAWVEYTGIIANLLGLVFLVLTLRRFGIMAAAWNTVFYNSLKLLLLLPILERWIKPRWRSPTLLEAWRRLRVLLPSHIYLRTDSLLDRLLASMTGAGVLSLFHLSHQVYASANLLLAKSVVSPMVPSLAVDARDANWRLYGRGYQKRLILVGGITVLGFAVILGTWPFLNALVGRAGITTQNVRLLWLMMVALAGVFVGGALSQLTAAAFYAAGNTKTPSKIWTITFTVCIPLKIAAFFLYGIIGLAVMTSVFFIANFVVQFVALRKAISRAGPDQRGNSRPDGNDRTANRQDVVV